MVCHEERLDGMPSSGMMYHNGDVELTPLS